MKEKNFLFNTGIKLAGFGLAGAAAGAILSLAKKMTKNKEETTEADVLNEEDVIDTIEEETEE